MKRNFMTQRYRWRVTIPYNLKELQQMNQRTIKLMTEGNYLISNCYSSNSERTDTTLLSLRVFGLLSSLLIFP